jgi:hypothetical protein
MYVSAETSKSCIFNELGVACVSELVSRIHNTAPSSTVNINIPSFNKMTSPTITANTKTLAEMEYTPMGPLLPKDGTPPFWASARERSPELGYDSDDDYTSDHHALADFDFRTREQSSKHSQSLTPASC